MKKYSQKIIDRAHAILDGVVEISSHDMLIHGSYFTRHIANENLAKQGAICGGRQACLLGSVAVSAVGGASRNTTIAETLDAVRFGPANLVNSWDGFSSEQAALRRRPALRLAIEALNEEAFERLSALRKTKRVRQALDELSPAEGYFEEYLEGASKPETHRHIVSLVEGAKARVA